MKPLYIPIGAKRAKGYCFKCGTTIFNKLDFNYFPQRSHLFASGYCKKCGAFKCNEAPTEPPRIWCPASMLTAHLMRLYQIKNRYIK